MASQGDDCYFFYYSSCAKGDSCPFRHQPAAFGNENVCELWRQGKCFHEACQFRHMVLDKNRTSIPCYWERQASGCLKSHCPFSHSKPRQLSNVAMVPPLDSASSSPIKGALPPLNAQDRMLSNSKVMSALPAPTSNLASSASQSQERGIAPLQAPQRDFSSMSSQRDSETNFNNNLRQFQDQFSGGDSFSDSRHARILQAAKSSANIRKRKFPNLDADLIPPPKENHVTPAASVTQSNKEQCDNGYAIGGASRPDNVAVKTYEEILREKALRKMYERRQQQQQQQPLPPMHAGKTDDKAQPVSAIPLEPLPPTNPCDSIPSTATVACTTISSNEQLRTRGLQSAAMGDDSKSKGPVKLIKIKSTAKMAEEKKPRPLVDSTAASTTARKISHGETTATTATPSGVGMTKTPAAPAPAAAVKVKTFEEVMKEKRLRQSTTNTDGSDTSDDATIPSQTPSSQSIAGTTTNRTTEANDVSRTQRIRLKRTAAALLPRKDDSTVPRLEQQQSDASFANQQALRSNPTAAGPSANAEPCTLEKEPLVSSRTEEEATSISRIASPRSVEGEAVAVPSPVEGSLNTPLSSVQTTPSPDPVATTTVAPTKSADGNNASPTTTTSLADWSEDDSDFDLDASTDDESCRVDHEATFNDDELLREIEDAINS